VKEAVRAELIAASTPINFAELERLGVLEEREGWHVLLKRDGLPRHARRQVRAVRQVRVAGCVTTRLKFRTTLRAREKRFIEEYLLSLNGAKAATQAGYSAKTARGDGVEAANKS